MSLKIRYGKAVDPTAAYKIVKKSITPEVIGKFKIKAAMDYDEDNLIIHAKGIGFHLTIEFLDEHAKVDLDVTFLLKAIKGPALSKIERMLSSVI